MKNSRFKPCPFCGGTEIVKDNQKECGSPMVYWKSFRFKCSECGAIGGYWRNSEEKAVEAWNQRQSTIGVGEDYIAEQIDYPKAWDIMAYPTLSHALWELYSWKV